MSKIKDTIIDRQELGLDIDLSSEPKDACCIGCDTKVGVTQCDNTLCYQCWSAENE